MPSPPDSQNHRVTGYRQLTREFGAGPVADALLRKWLADGTADAKWDRLFAAVNTAQSTRAVLRPSEARALTMLAAGHTYESAATALGLTHWTVADQVRSAIRRLDARNSTHAVAIAVRSGTITVLDNT